MLLMGCGGEPQPTPSPTRSLDSATPSAPVAPSASIGEQLVVNVYACHACHSADGTPLVGPTWLGLYGTEEELEDGTTVIVDDEYITESIKDPNAKITRGFAAGLMPLSLGVKDEEIPHIIEYMKSLR